MSLLNSIYDALLWLRLAVLRAIIWFEQTVIWKTTPRNLRSRTKTILLVGDGVAEGLGDQFGKTGLCGALSARLYEAKRYNQNRLRLPWRVATAGRSFTKSADWLPGSQLMRQQIIRDAAVVVVLLGSDVEDDELVENILRITESLLDEEKFVVVPGIPNYFDRRTHPSEYARMVETAKSLKERLEDLAKKYSANRPGNIQNGEQITFTIADGDLAKVCALGDDAVSHEGGVSTLNPRGYRLLTGEIYEDVLKAAKKVEWSYWKQELTGR